MALQWLVDHNPVYKNIKIDYTCLSSLPTEGIPSDLQKVHCTKISDYEIDPDRGPLDKQHCIKSCCFEATKAANKRRTITTP